MDYIVIGHLCQGVEHPDAVRKRRLGVPHDLPRHWEWHFFMLIEVVYDRPVCAVANRGAPGADLAGRAMLLLEGPDNTRIVEHVFVLWYLRFIVNG